MRNFFKNTWDGMTNIESKRQLEDILDTDEAKVLNQYRRYLNYINKVKKQIVNRSESFMRDSRSKYLKLSH
jgi:hypothetical protein